MTNRLEPELLRELADRFATPVYVYDAASVAARHRLLAGCLPAGMRLYYALKANPLIAIARLLQRLGCGAEVGSEGELRLALAAGYPPDDIIYTCPGKTREGIELAIATGIRAIVLETLAEAALVDTVARRAGHRANVALRINPAADTSAALAMSGRPTQFGFDEEELVTTLAGLAELRHLALGGIQVYMGTQILDADHLIETAARILELAVRWVPEPELVDIGGGFGLPYRATDRELDLERLRVGYQALADRHPRWFERGCVVAESGRYLVGDSGLFLTRVVGRKRSRGTTFVICDGGYPSHSAALHLGRTGENRHPVATLKPGDRERVTVVGPTGTPIDVLAREVELERAEVGDLLVVGRSGAYGYTNSCQLFFTSVTPAEVLIEGHRTTVMRERGCTTDLQGPGT